MLVLLTQLQVPTTVLDMIGTPPLLAARAPAATAVAVTAATAEVEPQVLLPLQLKKLQ